MDPPQEGDEDVNVVGGIMGRLGLEAGHQARAQSGRDFIESLGLGEGTRVVDLQVSGCKTANDMSLNALVSAFSFRTIYLLVSMNLPCRLYQISRPRIGTCSIKTSPYRPRFSDHPSSSTRLNISLRLKML